MVKNRYDIKQTVADSQSNHQKDTITRLPEPEYFRDGKNAWQPSAPSEKGDQKQPATKTNFSYFQLFRYSTHFEKCMIFIGILFASLGSLGIPLATIIYGEYISVLIDRSVGVVASSPVFVLSIFGGGKPLTNASKEENMAAIKDDAIAYGVGGMTIALAELICLAIAVDIVNRTALKQIGRIRKLFLESILRQEMSWYDISSGTSFANKMTEDLDKMKEGMGEKIAIVVFLLMTFVTGIIASFLYGWKLTLVVLTCCPFMMISTAVVAKIQASFTEKELKAYSGAGAVAEEVFSGIRTVLAFSGERKETERFSKLLVPADRMGQRKGLFSGIGTGAMWFVIYCCYALAMWYGVTLILEDKYEEVRHYTPAVMVIVMFGIIMGAQNLGFSSPHIEAFATAKAAAQNIFSIIDRVSAIDPLKESGVKPSQVVGNISFENLYFRYPARPDIEILKGFSLKVNAGQTVALVGASGCGKSTALHLMQRFYDPLSGSVKLDDQDVKELNVGWLRSNIGVVGQEPVLFATTIEENIRHGNSEATLKDIERAAKMANCHNFIMKLPQGYNTLVGERGAQMSGGQKQRIAIARALVRNPKILLLDEATSALDPTSEKRVQDALEVASKGRTTLVVSHRLSTVTNADKIVFVKDGVVVEQGTHDELMKMGGFYCQLVNITKRSEQVEYEEEMEANRTSTSDESRRATKESVISSKHRDSTYSRETISSDENQSYDSPVDHYRKSSREGKAKKEKYKVTFRQLMRLNAPEWRYILFGCIAAVINGATFPLWAIIFGNFFGIMSDEDDEYVKSKASLFSYMFLVIGVMAGGGTLIQIYMFNMAGVKMTSRLRRTTFSTIISQEVAYFDDEKNSVGALCARLAGDCSNVQGATGARIGVIIQAFSTLIVGILVAFIYSWNLTLVTLVTIPFVCLSIYFEARFMEASAYVEKVAIERASQMAVEAISNIRTVTSLGLEKYVLERYCEQIDLVDKACKKKVRFRGFVFGLGQSAPFIAYSLSLCYGGILVANDGLQYDNIIKVSEALIFGSWMLGQALAYAPNVGAAILSAGRLLKLFERTPAMYNSKSSPYNISEKAEGDITYTNVDFHYPSRKTIPILRNLNLNIQRGSTVALVGPSGSGKSTCIQLLLRYYDPVNGSVNLSGIPTTEFPLETLRSMLGLVSQEPVLFDRTIAENIAYGNNFRDDIPMAEIIAAAKKSNIHDFITSLPQGYDTSLGSKGAQLSGGQKQRIAIARALIRNPKILLLDEATSALDMHSEKVVQEALDAARTGRTCITIAHRLTTIRNADLICVLRKGLVVESGSHDELMSLNGIYAELYMMQQVV